MITNTICIINVYEESDDWTKRSIYEEISFTSSGLHETTMDEILDSYREYLESQYF